MNGLSESKGPFLCYHGGRRKVRREQSEQKGTNLNKTNQDKDKDKEKEKDKDKDKDKDFFSSGEGPKGPRLTAEKKETHPSLEEVISFSQQEGIETDVEYFYNYYEANGWYIGKRPIRDWKAALKAWARKTPPPRPAPTRQKSTRETFLELMERARIEEAKEV